MTLLAERSGNWLRASRDVTFFTVLPPTTATPLTKRDLRRTPQLRYLNNERCLYCSIKLITISPAYSLIEFSIWAQMDHFCTHSKLLDSVNTPISYPPWTELPHLKQTQQCL